MRIFLRAGLAAIFATISLAVTAWTADIETYGNMNVNGSVMANSFSGSGSGLTNIITNIYAGTGINIGAGMVSTERAVSVAPAYQLPQSCGSNQIPQWNGTGWSCGNSFAAGSGISMSAGMGFLNYMSIANQGIQSSMLAANSVNAYHIAFYNKVAIVAPNGSGGDYIDPAAAMTNLSSWCGIPSSSNPCLVKIMPGIYNVGTSSVAMHSYVDIEGSGENVTVIQGSIDSSTAGVVNGASPAELRFLTVSNVGGSGHTNSISIYNIYSQGKITNVTAEASGATNNFGMYNTQSYSILTNMTVSANGAAAYGIYNNGSANVTLFNVSVNVYSGGSYNSYGINNYNSSPNIKASSITASVGMGGSGSAYGIYNSGNISSTAYIDHSSVSGTTSSLYNNSNCTFYVAYTKLSGGNALPNGGTFACVGAYSGNYAALGTNCQ